MTQSEKRTSGRLTEHFLLLLLQTLCNKMLPLLPALANLGIFVLDRYKSIDLDFTVLFVRYFLSFFMQWILYFLAYGQSIQYTHLKIEVKIYPILNRTYLYWIDSILNCLVWNIFFIPIRAFKSCLGNEKES